MQAIQTKYIPPTNTRGSRIKAKCDRGFITISHPIQETGELAHRHAVSCLIEKFVREDTKLYGTPRDKNPWNRTFVTGGLPDGTYAHVFID